MSRSFRSSAFYSLSNHARLYSSSHVASRLEGKVALVTGAASGLGKATAKEFVRHGAKVVIADVDSDAGSKVANDIGDTTRFVQCDVAVEDDMEKAVRFTMARHGKLDIMHISSGISGIGMPLGITELDLQEFDEVMRINVRGTIVGIKHAARAMVPAGCGTILCMSSISGVLGGLGPPPYSISKFAIPGIVKSAASELCRSGVRINCISPGPISTPMTLRQLSMIYANTSRERIVEMIEGLGELKGAKCEEEDVARAALFLASDDAKFITGHNLVVDGGFTAYKHFQFPAPDKFV